MSDTQMKRTAKDSVFCDIFSNSKYLLELYRVLHPEDTKATEADLETITLKSILLDGIYNDLGFQVNDRLIVLVEAQSTWSPSIVIRSMMYLAQTWQGYFDKNNIILYGNNHVSMPKSELYVIYNKKRSQKPDYISFQEEYFPEGSCIEAKVKVLYHDDSDSIINQYIKFCLVLDDQKKQHGKTKKAIEETIRICRNENILVEYLNSRKVEVQNIMWTLFDQERINEIDRMNAAEEARQKALQEGKQEGKEQTTIENIKSLMASTDWSAEKAMTNLKIPTTDFPKYMASL